MREAALVVSGDTGPLHIAAAMGTPLVGLYGPTWPERNGPWDPEDVVISRASVCVCHHKRQCLRGAPCINEITLDEVVAGERSKRLAGQHDPAARALARVPRIRVRRDRAVAGDADAAIADDRRARSRSSANRSASGPPVISRRAKR